MTEIILPPIPEVYNITTGFDDLIEQQKDEFFMSVLDCIGYSDRARAAYCNIDPRELHKTNPSYHWQNVIETNDMITMLIASDYLVATVLVRRNDLNYCQVAFAHYLTPDLVMKLREGIII